MSGVRFATGLRNDRGQAVIDRINAGAGPGTAEFWSGPAVATGAAITTQTLAGIVTFAEPAGTVANGVLTLSGMLDDNLADNDCWVRFVRLKDGAGAFVMDLDVAENDGTLRNPDGTVEGDNDNAPVKMPSCHVFAGGVLRIASAAFTEGNA